MFKSFNILPLLLLIGQGLSADTWSPTETISTNVAPYTSIAVDPQGNSVAVFEYFDDTNVCVKASTRSAGGVWTEPVAISQTVPRKFDNPWITPMIYPSVCVDQEGDAVALWNFPEGNQMVMQAATLSLGSWTKAKTISTPLSLDDQPCLDIDGQGNALATWGAKRKGEHLIESARFLKSSGSWTALAPMKLSYRLYWISTAVDPAGGAAMIWMKDDKGAPWGENVNVATLSSDSMSWSTPTILSEGGGHYFNSQIAVDQAGNAIASWQSSKDLDNWTIEAYRHELGGNWIATTFSKLPASFTGLNALSFDPAGNATFLWEPVGKSWLFSTQLPSGSSTWTDPQNVIPLEEECDAICSAADHSGNLLVVWTNQKESLIKATTLPVGGSEWTVPDTVTSAIEGVNLDCVLVPGGSAVVWFQDPFETLNTVAGTTP